MLIGLLDLDFLAGARELEDSVFRGRHFVLGGRGQRSCNGQVSVNDAGVRAVGVVWVAGVVWMVAGFPDGFRGVVDARVFR